MGRDSIGKEGDVDHGGLCMPWKGLSWRVFEQSNRNSVSSLLMDMRVVSNYYYNSAVNSLVQYIANVTLCI